MRFFKNLSKSSHQKEKPKPDNAKLFALIELLNTLELGDWYKFL